MNPFESGNIWKRMAREKKRAEHPETPEQLQRRRRRGTLLWLLGGIVMLALFSAGIYGGILPLNLENGAILAIVGLYTIYNAVSLGRMKGDGKKNP